MFKIKFDLSDLQQKSEELVAEWDAKIEQVTASMPQLGVEEYMSKIRAGFNEMPFAPLSDVWKDGLRGLLDDF
jgi:hypothetical protein